MKIRELILFVPLNGANLADGSGIVSSNELCKELTETLTPHFRSLGAGKWKTFGHGTFNGKKITSIFPNLASKNIDDMEELAKKIMRFDMDAACRFTSFDVTDFEVAEILVRQVTGGTALKGAFGISRWFEDRKGFDPAQPYRSIEVYYNVSSIPDEFKNPLDFRNAAIAQIEPALNEQSAGDWAGAEMGKNIKTGEFEVSFGFEVDDFETAEKIVRNAVAGTVFDRIREITRHEYIGED